MLREAHVPRKVISIHTARAYVHDLQVFVAGGTGRLGARIVRQLLLQGLK
jgi:FlaA1/EpsC-like NDP-sugar epimerase